MKTVKQLYKRLCFEKNFPKRYPEYDPKDGKIHVLYVGACLNGAGYYRAVLPALELNQTGSHRAIVANLHKWDFNKEFNAYDSPIDARLIAWADYAVLPSLFTDAGYIINAMREINSDLDFVMDLDTNYHELPQSSPMSKKISAGQKETFLDNLLQADLFTAPSQGLLDYYQRLLEEKAGNGALPYPARIPDLLSHFTYENTKDIQRNPNDKVRLAIAVDSSQVEDIRIIEKPLISLLEKYAGKAELVLLGWTEKMALARGLFQTIPVIYEKPLLFTDHHERLNSLSIDIGLIPLEDSLFNRTSPHLTTYLDFAALMIPVIASGAFPYNKIIREGENGFLAASPEEWIAKTGELITNSARRKEIGAFGFKQAWERLSYLPDAARALREVFA